MLVGVTGVVIVLAALSRKLQLEFLEMKALDALRVRDLLALCLLASVTILQELRLLAS